MAFDTSPSEDASSASAAEKIATLPRKIKSPAPQRKRKQDTFNLSTTSEASIKKRKRTPTTSKQNCVAAVTYTIEGVLELWSKATEYGLSFRGMTPEEQKTEVAVLNKGAIKVRMVRMVDSRRRKTRRRNRRIH